MKGNPYQRHKINRVINFVRDCEDPVFSLDQMADVACLSRFHFTRVFSAFCGETPVEYLIRSSLESSVARLVHMPWMSITEIALAAGFSGSQAFSHAFRRRYGLGPKRFRDLNHGVLDGFPNDQREQHLLNLEKASTVKSAELGWRVSLRHQPERRLAYVRNIGPYLGLLNDVGAGDDLDQAFLTIAHWAEEKGIWPGKTPFIGICPNNPVVTPPRLCQYDVAIPVDDTVKEDETVSILHMPATQIAALEMAGNSAALMRAWQWLTSCWIPQNGLVPTGQVPFEEYQSNDVRKLYPEYGITLCVPVFREMLRAFPKAVCAEPEAKI